jgi:hypothetical protein
MKSALQTYSAILQFRTDAIRALLATPHGIAYALKLFLIVVLIAGLGRYFAVPALMQQLTLAEQIDRGVAAVRAAESAAVTAIWDALVANKPFELPSILAASAQRQADQVLDQISVFSGGFIAQTSAVERLLRQEIITPDEVAAAVAQSPATVEQLDRLLERANLPINQANAILSSAGITAEQVTSARAARTAAATTADASALAELTPLTTQLDMTDDQMRATLADFGATPEQLTALLNGLGITATQLAQKAEDVALKVADVQSFVGQVRAEAARLDPLIGARPARLVKLTGAWLATPFEVAANYIFFALMLLLVARSLGGRATLPQHLAAVALAAAPGVLWLGAYIPDMRPVLPVAMSGAIDTFANLLALIGLLWGAALLLKTVAVAHGFGMWKTAGTVVLTWLVINVVLPLGTLWAGWYLLG